MYILVESDHYFKNVLLQNTTKIFDWKLFHQTIASQSLLLINDEYPNGVLNFNSKIYENSCNITFNVFSDQVLIKNILKDKSKISKEVYEETFLKYLNQHKTLKVRFSIIKLINAIPMLNDESKLLNENFELSLNGDLIKDNNEKIKECILIEAQLSKYRQNFDMDFLNV